MTSISYNEYPALCCEIARDAGKLIMGYFSGRFVTSQKEDKSPVTDADIAANQLIVKALTAMAPEIPIVAEEDEEINAGGHELFWLVDPLDGTRAFVRGEPEFTVNIGLIHKGKPVFGVIYAPPQDALYWGEAGKSAYRMIGNGKAETLQVRAPAPEGLIVVRSKSHPSATTAAYMETLKIKETICGSSSIKFCMVAEGSADIYPRFGRTMEWDTAAGHAILAAAGGRVETVDGRPLAYGKPGFENPAFIAFGG